MQNGYTVDQYFCRTTVFLEHLLVAAITLLFQALLWTLFDEVQWLYCVSIQKEPSRVVQENYVQYNQNN